MTETEPLPLRCKLIVACERCDYKTNSLSPQEAIQSFVVHSMREHRYKPNNAFPVDVRQMIDEEQKK